MSISRAIEARSGGRRGWRWTRWSRALVMVASALLLAGLAGFAARTWRMSGLPDAPEPFDTSGARGVVVPEEANAYPKLVKARYALGPELSPFGPILTRREAEWANATPEARAWVEAHREALELFRLASRATAMQVPASRKAGSGIEAVVLEELPLWLRFVLLETGRLEEAGDLGGAWTWHEVRLRMTQLMGGQGSLNERRYGSYVLADVVARTKLWADHPQVTVALLRRAIADIEAMGALDPKPSASLKVEYARLMSDLADPETAFGRLDDGEDRPVVIPNPGRGTTSRFRPPEPLRPLFRRVEWWLGGEPERSRRVARLIFANWLAQADKPRAQRTRLVSDAPLVFDAEPGATPLVAPADLASLAASAPLFTLYRIDGKAWSFMFSIDQWPLGIDANRRTRADLIVVFASRIQEIETGRFPETPEQLVPRTLPKLPDDYAPPDAGDAPRSDAP